MSLVAAPASLSRHDFTTNLPPELEIVKEQEDRSREAYYSKVDRGSTRADDDQLDGTTSLEEKSIGSARLNKL